MSAGRCQFLRALRQRGFVPFKTVSWDFLFWYGGDQKFLLKRLVGKLAGRESGERWKDRMSGRCRWWCAPSRIYWSGRLFSTPWSQTPSADAGNSYLVRQSFIVTSNYSFFNMCISCKFTHSKDPTFAGLSATCERIFGSITLHRYKIRREMINFVLLNKHSVKINVMTK